MTLDEWVAVVVPGYLAQPKLSTNKTERMVSDIFSMAEALKAESEKRNKSKLDQELNQE